MAPVIVQSNEALRDQMQDRLRHLYDRKAELERTTTVLAAEAAGLGQRIPLLALDVIEDDTHRPAFIAARQRQRELPGLLAAAREELAAIGTEIGHVEPEHAAVLREIADNAPPPTRIGLPTSSAVRW